MKVELLIGEITRLATKTRWEGEEGLMTTIQFSAKLPPATMARMLNLQRQGVPLYAAVGSHQSVMDLNVQEDHGNAEETKPTQVDIFGLG